MAGKMGKVMGKEKSAKPMMGAKGGKTKMFGKQAAGPQKPGVSGHATSGEGGKFAKGGKTKMFGKQSSKPVRPGTGNPV